MDSENKKQILKDLKKLKSAKDWDSMLAASQKAIQMFPGDQNFMSLMHYAQAHYVDEKLHSAVVMQLEEKEDWETLQDVYRKLLNVFPDSKKLHKLLRKLKKKIDEGEVKQSKEQTAKVKSQILAYMKEGRLDDALQACYEVLSQNPEAEEFERLAEKVEHKLDGQIEKDLTVYFKTSVPELDQEYKTNKEAFIRV